MLAARPEDAPEVGGQLVFARGNNLKREGLRRAEVVLEDVRLYEKGLGGASGGASILRLVLCQVSIMG